MAYTIKRYGEQRASKGVAQVSVPERAGMSLVAVLARNFVRVPTLLRVFRLV